MNDLLKCRERKGKISFTIDRVWIINEGCFFVLYVSKYYIIYIICQDVSSQRADDNFFGIFHLGMN